MKSEKEQMEYFKKLAVFVMMMIIFGTLVVVSSYSSRRYYGVVMYGPNGERTYYPEAVALMGNSQNENELGLKDVRGRIYKKLDKREYRGYVACERYLKNWDGMRIIFESECK